MEIFWRRKCLSDQFRADHFAVAFDQAAVGLVRKEQLGQSGHTERVDETGQDRHEDDHQDGGTDLADHGGFLQARPTAVTKRSMSLMPTNGTAMPPSP